MDVNSALLFVAACPSFCMGHRLRNSDMLSLSVEAAVTFPGDAAPEFCAAEALPVWGVERAGTPRIGNPSP
jgi:hypothetical protein